MNLLHFIIENVWCQIEVYKYLLSSKNSPIELESGCLYSMKIKEQARKLAVGCSKQRFEVVDEACEVTNIYNVKLTWFERFLKSIILQLVANVWLAYETG